MTASRLVVAIILTVGVYFTALAAEGQPADKVRRIGILGMRAGV